jgi:hypothetical protein
MFVAIVFDPQTMGGIALLVKDPRPFFLAIGHEGSPLSAPSAQAGGMFWFRRKKLSGSTFRFSVLSRSYFSAP